MKKNINIAIVGLGQIGIYLLNELNTKKKILNLKLEKKLMLLLYLQKINIKKESSNLIKIFFLKIL